MRYNLGYLVFLVLLLHACATEQQISNPTSTLIDERDGKVYTTVKIGDQWWMSENLNHGAQITSFSGGSNQDGEMTDNQIFEKYCYENNEVYCEMYGGLYQWNEAINYIEEESTQGICPDGWHVPSREEFQELLNIYPTCTDLRLDGNSGFNALLSGNKFRLYFDNLNDLGLFWSSSSAPIDGRYLLINKSNGPALINTDYKKYGLSIRCVSDDK